MDGRVEMASLVEDGALPQPHIVWVGYGKEGGEVEAHSSQPGGRMEATIRVTAIFLFVFLLFFQLQLYELYIVTRMFEERLSVMYILQGGS